MNKCKAILALLIFLIPNMGFAQSLTLDEVVDASNANFPLIKQYLLLQRSGEYSLQNISKGALPQLSVIGQASYQSDVTSIPINLPNVTIPEISKDQYRIYAEAIQPLTELITVSRQRGVQRANNELALLNLRSELYKVTDRVYGIYFGILLLDEQLKQNALTITDIQAGINKVSAAVNNGTDYRSNLDKLKAQILTARQREDDLKASRKAYVQMLSLFMARSLPDTVILINPERFVIDIDINRPELRAFESQVLAYDAQLRLINTRSLPKLALFAQGGYGRPAFNQLDNDFKTFYIGGLRLNWSLSSYYTLKKERSIISLNKEMVFAQKETFLFNTHLTLQQQSEEVTRLQVAVQTDAKIVALRSSIKAAALAQLQNGVITVNDYLKEVTSEAQAREQTSFHLIQLLQAEYSIKTTTGN